DAGCEETVAGTIRIELEDRRAAAVLTRVVVRLRSDGHVHLVAGAVEDHVARRVPSRRQIHELLGGALCLLIPVRVLEADQRAGVADVQIAVVECEAERRCHLAGALLHEFRRRGARRRARAKQRSVDGRVHGWCSGCKRRRRRAPPTTSATTTATGRTARPSRRRLALGVDGFLTLLDL